MIASVNEGLTYFIEVNDEDLGLHVLLGDESIWDYKIDAHHREASFVLQYEQMGKFFLWQKFDQQKQFHLTKPGCFEMLCDNTLIRVTRDGCQLEIKNNLERFEDSFYDFLPMEFEGLPIIVSSFSAFKIPDCN
jgi:hypothetical protein